MSQQLFIRDSVIETDGWRRASPAEVLAYVATLPGVQVFDTPRPTSGPWLKPGRYLIVPYEEEESDV